MANAFSCCTSTPAVMSPSHVGSPLPPSVISLLLSIQKIDPNDQIDPLIDIIGVQLQRIKASPEKTSTSSSVLESLVSKTSLAAHIVDTFSTEADKLYMTDLAKEMGGLVLEGLKMVGKPHWIFLVLSVAAYVLEFNPTVPVQFLIASAVISSSYQFKPNRP